MKSALEFRVGERGSYLFDHLHRFAEQPHPGGALRWMLVTVPEECARGMIAGFLRAVERVGSDREALVELQANLAAAHERLSGLEKDDDAPGYDGAQLLRAMTVVFDAENDLRRATGQELLDPSGLNRLLSRREQRREGGRARVLSDEAIRRALEPGDIVCRGELQLKCGGWMNKDFVCVGEEPYGRRKLFVYQHDFTWYVVTVWNKSEE